MSLKKDGKKVTTRAVFNKESVCLVSEIQVHWIITNSCQHQYYKTGSKPGLIDFKEKKSHHYFASEIATGCKTGVFLGLGLTVMVLLKMIMIIPRAYQFRDPLLSERIRLFTSKEVKCLAQEHSLCHLIKNPGRYSLNHSVTSASP